MNEDTRKAAMPPPPPPPSRTSVGKCQLRSKLFLIRLGKEAAEEKGRRVPPLAAAAAATAK